ncbi:hypothetical protein OROHE_005732 [Orobanche hederae]
MRRGALVQWYKVLSCDMRSWARVLGAASCQFNWQGKACPLYTLVVGPFLGLSPCGDRAPGCPLE